MNRSCLWLATIVVVALSRAHSGFATETYWQVDSGNWNEYVGYSGTGTVVQVSGTHTVSNDLYLGYNADAVGSYALGGYRSRRPRGR